MSVISRCRCAFLYFFLSLLTPEGSFSSVVHTSPRANPRPTSFGPSTSIKQQGDSFLFPLSFSLFPHSLPPSLLPWLIPLSRSLPAITTKSYMRPSTLKPPSSNIPFRSKIFPSSSSVISSSAPPFPPSFPPPPPPPPCPRPLSLPPPPPRPPP